jgi:hypothetical protein
MADAKPLTAKQLEAIQTAEPTLFGDFRVSGPAVPSLRVRGLAQGYSPHVYLTDAGKQLRA